MFATLIACVALGQSQDVEKVWVPRIVAAMQAAGVPEKWERYCLALELERQRAIVRLGQGISRLADDIATVRRGSERGPVKAARIKQLTARSKEWATMQKKLRAFEESPDVRLAPEVGSVGRLEDNDGVKNWFLVLQVTGDDKARVKISTVAGSVEVMLRGVDTSKLVDGRYSQSEETFEAFGTERYLTVQFAPRQLVAIRPISKADLDEAQKWHAATVAKLKAQPAGKK
jgi:hypothetical protein